MWVLRAGAVSRESPGQRVQIVLTGTVRARQERDDDGDAASSVDGTEGNNCLSGVVMYHTAMSLKLKCPVPRIE